MRKGELLLMSWEMGVEHCLRMLEDVDLSLEWNAFLKVGWIYSASEQASAFGDWLVQRRLAIKEPAMEFEISDSCEGELCPM